MNKIYFSIGIDMDDTIEDLLEAWILWLNKTYCLNVKKENVLEWDMKISYPTLTQQQILEPLQTREFWKTVKLKQDVVTNIKKLYDDGHDIYIITASEYETLVYKFEEILFKYFPFIDKDNIIICKQKQLLNLDILIDDNSNNLLCGNYYKILFDAPYNSNLKESARLNYKRVKSWNEIYTIIDNLRWFYSCNNLLPK